MSWVNLVKFCLFREELTFEMLTLEPRASDDETLESEASIGTADSSENLNVDSEGTISDFSGMQEIITQLFMQFFFLYIEGQNLTYFGLSSLLILRERSSVDVPLASEIGHEKPPTPRSPPAA